MQIIECFHTALLVTDLQKAEDFYSHVLGLTKIDRNLNYPGTWYQIGNFQLHLIVDSSISTDLHNAEKLGRNPHLAFKVADLEAAKTQLIAGNYFVQSSASGRSALFTKDPDNNIIELTQI